MRVLALALACVLLFSASGYAVTFDDFIGEYSVDGKVGIINDGYRTCNRFGLEGLYEVVVEHDSGPFNQSHTVTLKSDQRGMWLESYHPINEFREVTDGGSVNYAETRSRAESVENEWGAIFRPTVEVQKQEALILGLELIDGEPRLYVQEYTRTDGVMTASCYYMANLVKK